MNKVSIIGFGRFGVMLHSLLSKGFEVDVYDKNSISMNLKKVLEKFTQKINSSALMVSSIMIIIMGLTAYAEMPYLKWILPLTIFGPIVLLFVAYLANNFHDV